MRTPTALLLLCGLTVSACQQAPSAAPPVPTEPTGLEGTSWMLLEITSPDDRTGTIKPDNPESYTMTLGPDFKVSMKLNCNRGMGTWTAGSAGGNSGGFEFGPLSMTKALCKPPSLDQQIARDAAYVRSYVLDNGTLYLHLMADGGTYVWRRTP